MFLPEAPFAAFGSTLESELLSALIFPDSRYSNSPAAAMWTEKPLNGANLFFGRHHSHDVVFPQKQPQIGTPDMPV